MVRLPLLNYIIIWIPTLHSSMVGFNSRLVVAEQLCNKSLANVPHFGHTSRNGTWILQIQLKRETWRIGAKTLALKRLWYLRNGAIPRKRSCVFLLGWWLMLPWAMTVALEKRTVLHSFSEVKSLQGYSKTCGRVYKTVGFKYCVALIQW